MSNTFREVPGYPGYGVTQNGMIKSLKRDKLITPFLLNGYYVVDTWGGTKTGTLPVHRAVALAWVENPNPELFTVVNHIDGNPTNNRKENLEWTSVSGNNYHAVNNGLRSDNISCQVRDFKTGEVHWFNSVSQAAEFMGLRKDVSWLQLNPKMFGALTAGRYEFRAEGDPRPWFYEKRPELINPSRYMILVKDVDGNTTEVYSTKSLLKAYQLYDASSQAIPALVKHGNVKYPHLHFSYVDSYQEEGFRVKRTVKPSRPFQVSARKGTDVLNFDSLTKCASHFGVDRSSVFNRIKNGKQLDGWIFETRATPASNSRMLSS